MIKKQLLLFLTLVLTTVSSSGSEVTLYRTIEGRYATLESAQEHVAPASDIVERDGKFYIVSGLFGKFEDAMPEDPEHTEWNKRWKHVLPVKSSADEARQQGFEIPVTIPQQIRRKPEFATIPVNKPLANVLRSTTARVKAIEENTDRPENQRRQEMIQILEPQLDKFAAVAERAADPQDAAFAQYWLAKTCYIKGVALSVERLPKTSFNHERMAWLEEELCYDSAMEAIDTFLERFPNHERTEEVAYLKAATSYHLTYRGHHRHQVELAQKAYQDFIDQYPNSERVPRAKLNLLGISLELARIDGDGFEEVITIGESLLDEYPNANDYIRSRASLIVAEAYYEGENKDYEKAIERCDKILAEFIDTDRRSVIGSAFRLKGYSLYFLGNYNAAIENFTMVIEFWQNPEYHFGYQVEENLAAAYYWRGNAYKNLGLNNVAKTDFQTAVDLYPENAFANWAEGELEVFQIEEK